MIYKLKKFISLFIRYVIIGIKTRIKKEGLIYEKNVYDTPCFPTPNIKQTADFYVQNLGFNAVEYLNSKEPHICLYKDNIEIILTDSKGKKVVSNHELYGYGYDVYIIVENQEELQKEFDSKELKIVKRLS